MNGKELLNLDNASLLFWTITYLIIVYNGIKFRQERKLMMPLVPSILNLSWEINAVIRSRGMIGHILWFVPDVLIGIINLYNLEGRKRMIYIASAIAAFFLFLVIFNLPGEGMLISSFVIDFIMALIYVLQVKKISYHGKIAVAVCKLIGDFAAWLYYMNYSFVIRIIGPTVFCLNVFYLACCLELDKQNSRKKRRSK